METETQPSDKAHGGDRLRWWILGLLFFSTVLNYVDRQTLSLLATTVQADLKMSDMDYAGVVQGFLIAYTLAYLVVGRLTDRLGSKISLALFVGWWSIANMATGFVTNMSQLWAARFALGLGEAGNYTAAPKAVSEWFAPKERAIGVGIYTAGAMVGATISPPLIGWLALTHGWRAAFVVTGALGFLWLAAWFAIYRRSPPVQTEASEAAPSELQVWKLVVSDRRVWALVGARFLTDPVWYFYLFWFPKYLSDDRGMGLLLIAQLAWIVYLAADAGSLTGGFASGRLIKRGWAPDRARMAVMAAAALIAPVGAFISLSPAIGITLGLAGVVAFCHLVWQVNLTSLVVDQQPQPRVATAFGLIAAGSGLGGMLSTGLVGRLVSVADYHILFLVMACLYPLGLVLAATAVIPRRRDAVAHV
ncbi:MFS transporter [Brevundimonas sp. TWP2-3-4b1]|uniref:MFS transporter n=1 Tax=Brevundimonas sp. TWP2-3-4b1 TaxID=2804580 RepID=UPI003CF95B9C